MFTVTAAFESLKPRAQDFSRREDAMNEARALSEVSRMDVLVAPKGAAQPSCVFKDGKMVACYCPGGRKAAI